MYLVYFKFVKCQYFEYIHTCISFIIQIFTRKRLLHVIIRLKYQFSSRFNWTRRSSNFFFYIYNVQCLIKYDTMCNNYCNIVSLGKNMEKNAEKKTIITSTKT